MKESSKALGRPVTQQTIIMDMKGLSLRPDSRSTKIFRDTVDIDQNYYPERLCNLFIINAPWVFKGIWHVLKPWIDPTTREKFHIYGTDYRDALLEFIDSDQIPVEFGGTSTIELPQVAK
jgi:hypothetical protein